MLFTLSSWLFVMMLMTNGPPTQTPRCTLNLDSPVPSFVLASASGTTADFAATLAEARVCAGFVVRGDRSTGTSRVWRYESSAPETLLRNAVERFADTHQDFAIDNVNGALLFRDRAIDTTGPPLSTPIPIFEVTGIRAVEALREAAYKIAPALPRRGGIAASTLGRPGEPEPSIEDLAGPVVSVELQNTTFLDALIAISQQAPGVVWLLVEEERAEGRKEAGFRLSCRLPRGGVQPIANVSR